MKKWITSNYHYMVPEYEGVIKPDFTSFLDEVRRGIASVGKDRAAPVVLGPVTMAYLTRIPSFAEGLEESERQILLDKFIPIYKDLLAEIAATGASEIQIHEPALVFEDTSLLSMFKKAYPLILPSNGPAINIVSFMDDVGPDHYAWLIAVDEFDILSMDFTRGNTLALIQKYGFPSEKTLGAGLVDARGVWCVDPSIITPVIGALAEYVDSIRVQPSASLQFVPWDLSCEKDLLSHPAGAVLSFAMQKLEEVAAVAKSIEGTSELGLYASAWEQYRKSNITNPSVQKRLAGLSETDFHRSEAFATRRPKQLQGVPLLPTTTIGSFPQTREVRQMRTKLKKGAIDQKDYEAAVDVQIAYAIGVQEALGLDILVHGEAERTDMVEFFGQQLEGMLFSVNGWVQSFGSRCVRPPIIWADISRPNPMTVREFEVAQSMTQKPVKGMLTGPVTILNWSFTRSDISRKEQAMQLGLSLRDEIADLEAAGCVVIQVDEPALREAMPLRKEGREEYLRWAVDSFCLSTAKAASETQIHTHMCYCEFQDCMDAIDRMDTDVNSIENARSDNATLRAFAKIGYAKDLGPGTYDIHSPVVPPVAFIESKLKSFLECMDLKKLVVNPDCGLKTRTWKETTDALRNMVMATHNIRSELNIV